MDWLFGLVVLGGVGLYVMRRRKRRPAQGPRAAAEVAVSELTPDPLRTVVEAQSRQRAKCFRGTLVSGETVAFGYSPGNASLDVFAMGGEGEYGAFRFSMAQRGWTGSTLPAEESDIRQVIGDTFP